jgi:hypothetical protein
MKTRDKVIPGVLSKFQSELLQRADSIGLMEHSSTNGMLKEFLVKSVLESILPKSCGIYSGIVFDGKGNKSKQIDIIIYDDRVPRFELSKGLGFYPVEGVIATIEVKSNLKKNDMMSALDNCYSVLKLQPLICGDLKISIDNDWMKLSSPSQNRDALFQYSAASYIFSFDSVKMDTSIKHVQTWCHKNDEFIKNGIALVPRGIVGKNWIGFLDDSYISLPETELAKSASGNAMVFIETENYFSYFVSHLLHKISMRIKANQGVCDSYYSINKLLPLEKLVDDSQSNNKYLIF